MDTEIEVLRYVFFVGMYNVYVPNESHIKRMVP